MSHRDSDANPPDYGTGFLVGPDVLMTNYHVMENVINGLVPATQVRLRFDYKMLVGGVQVNPGTEHRLALGSQEQWLLYQSPYSQADLSAEPGQPPGVDELDFVLLRLAAGAGTEAVGAPALALQEPHPRGWISVPRVTHDFAVAPSLFILQHPDGRPMKLTLDTDSGGPCAAGSLLLRRSGSNCQAGGLRLPARVISSRPGCVHFGD